LVGANAFEEGFKAAFGEDADGGCVFLKADAVDLGEAGFLGDFWDERLDCLGV